MILAILVPIDRAKMRNPLPIPIDNAAPIIIHTKQKHAISFPCFKISECGPSMKLGKIIAVDSNTTKIMCFRKNERHALVKSLTTNSK